MVKGQLTGSGTSPLDFSRELISLYISTAMKMVEAESVATIQSVRVKVWT